MTASSDAQIRALIASPSTVPYDVGGVVTALLKLAVSPDDEEFNSRVVAYNSCEYASGMDFCIWHDKLLGCEAACCDVGFAPSPADVYRKVLLHPGT